jgi:integrase/recombinase XerC
MGLPRPKVAPKAFDPYLEHLRIERRLAARTLALYAHALDALDTFARAGKVPLQRVQVHHVRGWLAQLHARGQGARTLALTLSAWRGLYRWWGRDGLVALNPADGVRAPKAGRPLPKALSVDHAVALADHVDEQGQPALTARDRLVVELLYGCGLRVAELTGLDVQPLAHSRGWVDIAADETTAHVLGKGGKRRSVPVGAPARAALQAWLVLRPALAAPDESALLVSTRGTRLTDSQVRTRLRSHAIRAGLPTHVHPHMLRHSFASHLLQSSGDLRAVQELLGHAAITTTQVYTRLDHQHLATIYDKAHPRAKRATSDEGAKRATPDPRAKRAP